MSGLRLPRAVMPLEKVRFVHSCPTYNLGVRRAIEGVEFDKATGMLHEKGSGDPLWLVKGEGLCSPAEFWDGDRIMPAWDKTTDWGAYHGAVDICPDPKGSQSRVHSAFPGDVVSIFKQGNHSCRVLVLTEVPGTDIQFLTIYQHLGPGLVAKKGDRVKPGDVLGYLGGWEGKLWGNEHLHVEVISKKRLPPAYGGVGDAYCVPCPEFTGSSANSQFPDDVFKGLIELPYVMSNLIPALAGWNKYASSAPPSAG